MGCLLMSGLSLLCASSAVAVSKAQIANIPQSRQSARAGRENERCADPGAVAGDEALNCVGSWKDYGVKMPCTADSNCKRWSFKLARSPWACKRWPDHSRVT